MEERLDDFCDCDCEGATSGGLEKGTRCMRALVDNMLISCFAHIQDNYSHQTTILNQI